MVFETPWLPDCAAGATTSRLDFAAMQQSQLFRIWASIAQKLMREPDIRSASLWQVGASDMAWSCRLPLLRQCVPQACPLHQMRLPEAGVPLCWHVLVRLACLQLHVDFLSVQNVCRDFPGEALAMIAAFCVDAMVVHGDRPKAETYRRLAQLCSAKDLDQAIAVAVSLLPDLAPAEGHRPLGSQSVPVPLALVGAHWMQSLALAPWAASLWLSGLHGGMSRHLMHVCCGNCSSFSALVVAL